MTPKQQQLIDDYHAGRLDADQVQSFESELVGNPDMQTESNLQSDIINGLKEFRKQELKSRLDAIPISGGWIQAAYQSAFVKVSGGIVAVALLGSGIYFFTSDGVNSTNSENGISIDAPEYVSETYVWELGEESQVVNAEQLEKLTEMSQADPSLEVDLEKPTPTESLEEPASAAAKEGKGAFVPDFSVPSTVDVASEESFESEAPGNLPVTEIADSNAPIDVKSTQSKGVIKYKYYDGKLFLSGDFAESPYEILEINRPEGRSIFVFYQQSFYAVGLSDKLVDLPMVKDAALIEELQILQRNK